MTAGRPSGGPSRAAAPVRVALAGVLLVAACSGPGPAVPGVSPSASPSAASAATCTFTYERDETGPGAAFRGAGFAPDSALTLTIRPSGGEPTSLTEADLPELRSDVRGAFETYLRAERGDVGTALFELSDGECLAVLTVVTPADAFPVECALAADTVASGGPAIDAYAADVARDEPLRYWRFEEHDGTVLEDEAGDGDASVVGMAAAVAQPGFVDGSRAILMRSDAGPGWLAIEPIELDGDFTLEAWLRLCGDEVTNADALFGQADEGPGVNLHDWFLRLWSGEHDPAVAQVPVPAQGWFHVAIVRAGDALILYQDGAEVGRGEYADPFPIGALAGGNAGSLEGWLDEVAVYDHALSPERVAAHAAHAR